ncbi:hypothetical protein [Desulfogranum japonicum]|uniref:hypothetical protein n=1 Tax=Desulfogranum japonicum TaxID=231447 RepID=UPI0004268EA8|nr:hypothetical protein [Desulfogranum japonicum]
MLALATTLVSTAFIFLNMIKLISEPVNKEYKKLIDFAASKCSAFSLVWKYDLALDESTKTIHELLKSHQVSEEIITSKWVTDKKAIFPILRKFLINHESIKELKDIPAKFACPDRESKASWRIDSNRKPGLFSWVSPCLPEDLVFYSQQGEIWLEAVSHEEEFYMYDSESANELMLKIPSIKNEKSNN